jgi:hypothetical protein
MIDSDRDDFGRVFFVLCETFGEPISDLRTEGYFAALGDFSIDQARAAMNQALRSCKFFPKPVELRELIEGRTDDAAEQAWGAVLGEIRRVGYIGVPALEPRALRAVNELWGSWRRLCETLPAEGPELVGWIKQFKATYQGASREAVRELTMGSINPAVSAFIQTKRKEIAERVQ